MTEIRINKFLAQAGVCSRRKADELVANGRVRVNGSIVVDMGHKINATEDKVTLDGELVEIESQETKEHTYVMLHKPIQIVSTVSDPQGRKTVIDVLPAKFRQKRLFPVGRLDYFSEGLLLLTDDGELTHRLTHPKFHLDKVYHVLVREDISESCLETMRLGMTLEDGTTLAPVEVKVSVNNPHLLIMVLHQGVNRQIRRMCKDLGLTILSLKRTQIGPLYLGSLAKGSARELNQREIAILYSAVGL